MTDNHSRNSLTGADEPAGQLAGQGDDLPGPFSDMRRTRREQASAPVTGCPYWPDCQCGDSATCVGHMDDSPSSWPPGWYILPGALLGAALCYWITSAVAGLIAGAG